MKAPCLCPEGHTDRAVYLVYSLGVHRFDHQGAGDFVLKFAPPTRTPHPCTAQAAMEVVAAGQVTRAACRYVLHLMALLRWPPLRGLLLPPRLLQCFNLLIS
ncbi:hypothetical protein CY34DRAFT_19704 [Suillus luteus UH-Slu-Lm8-n1]|uniref:Uncharacterized protein n=1 Tax=Suillus luteus UH-Slu-Lm8-n1 TaxID=930992 RepID=A0A0C9ZQP6_9AGAM|nr:hypothetical protein CY34DRAFT_19704 [Suillus luteus UH-Slu-Lm8-n1]